MPQRPGRLKTLGRYLFLYYGRDKLIGTGAPARVFQDGILPGGAMKFY